MTKEQLKMLRTLIQGEIEYAQQADRNFWGSFDQERSNDQGWEDFMETFAAEQDD
jgi:hypothetical protein